MNRTPALLSVALLAACTDRVTAPDPARVPTLAHAAARRDALAIRTYVAMGTSLSMGVMSNGVTGADQAGAWPAQLAARAGIPFTQPLIAAPGCQPPLAAPLASLRRVNGESPFVRSAVCSPLVAGIAVPANNVSISEALSVNGLTTTPETPSPASWPLKGTFYSRVLAPGQTQLTAMLAQHPDLVSFEFGVNEVLGVRSGLLAPGVTFVPYAAWQPVYDQLVAGVATAGARVVAVGMPRDVATFPSLRTGAELWADREELASFGIVVHEDCGTSASGNEIYVPAKVVGAYATGLAARAAGVPAPAMSCADVPGTQDFVLTPADVAAVDAQLAAMNAHIREVAEERGWAFFDLAPLYSRRGLKAPFSATALLTTDQPYGPYISLDGVHPSAAGHAILAREAAKALNVTYHLGIERGMAEEALP